MKTLALEEHFVTKAFLKATGADKAGAPEPVLALRGKLLDLGAGRIAAMDEGGVSMQVLSLAALGVAKLRAEDEIAVMRDVHDEAAAAVNANPERFAAFATPGLKNPVEAVKELERCVRKLGFKGLLVNGTTDGKFLDDPQLFPVLEAAAALGVPLYLHPAEPPEAVREAYYGGLAGEAGHLLSIAGWGWHAENGLHLLRLIVAGVLERLPSLQVIVGHMGEGVPYALARTNQVLAGVMKGKRSVMETMKQQVWVTTSGYFTQPPFACCRQVVGLDRMMYSVDYPFSPNTKGKDFLAGLPLEAVEMEALVWGNAARVLGIGG